MRREEVKREKSKKKKSKSVAVSVSLEDVLPVRVSVWAGDEVAVTKAREAGCEDELKDLIRSALPSVLV